MYLDKEELEMIVGRTITSISQEADQSGFTLYTDDHKQLRFYVTGDCCSESWIEHVTIPKLPAKIVSVESKDLGGAPATRQECDKKYSTIFNTDQGVLEIEYRNSSNGYYGGSLEFGGES